ncbi:retrovirus-related Pol polyprotein from transposon opus [Trichonephila clavipes]|nr:retrovirus-related Pol polyprotein from transposon opus [Trichonephila clavipes]
MDVHQFRSFLGLCTYYRKFVKNFSTIARPLYKLTEAKQKFIWTGECDNAFNKLKDALTSAPILAYPEIGKQFILDTDASHESIGAVLSQEIDGQERVIAYFSKCLSKPERNYCVTRKELLAIVKAVEHFHPYLYEGQIARWIQRLQEYDVEIRHRKGSVHGNADAFSRRSCPESCQYCSRIEQKFGVIDAIVLQVTTPSISALDPWSDESVRKDQLADPEIKPITEFKESSDEKPSWQGGRYPVRGLKGDKTTSKQAIFSIQCKVERKRGRCQGSHEGVNEGEGFSERTLDAEVDDPELKRERRERWTHQPVVHERDA